jgi:hypothetical protein
MAELKHGVVLRESTNKMPVAFNPGDELPDWAAEQLENSPHLFEDDAAPAPVDEVVIPAPADQKPITGQIPGAGPLTEPAATELGKTEIVDEDEPPKRNASGLAWRTFAEAQGVPVTDDMDRNDIIKACEEAGVVEAR